MLWRRKSRWVATICALLLLAPSGSAQEKRQATTVETADAAFDVDLRGVTSLNGASITIRNLGSNTIGMPWVSTPGAVAPLNADAIVRQIRSGGAMTDPEFATAVWRFVLEHSTAYCSAGSAFDGWASASNPMHILHGYGFACCDQSAIVLTWLWGAAGFKTRIAMMNFHTVAEVYYGEAWHMFDADHRVYYLARDNTTVASVEQIIADPFLVERTADAQGRDPVGWRAADMARLYVENAASLRYLASSFTAPKVAEFSLRNNESVTFRDENLQPVVFYREIAGAAPIAPVATASAEFQWRIPYSANSRWWADAYRRSNVDVITGADGKKALVATNGTLGQIVYRFERPYPLTRLTIQAELQSAATGGLRVYVSKDGSTWGAANALITGSSTGIVNRSIDLSALTHGALSYFLMFELVGSSVGDLRLFRLEIDSEVQAARQLFPDMVAGEVQRLRYRDLSAETLSRRLHVTVSVPTGDPQIRSLSARSLVAESPTYSIAASMEARRLVDDDTFTAAYPGAFNVDYAVALGGTHQLSGLSIDWNRFGTDAAYVRDWAVYTRIAGGEWQKQEFGGFPGASTTDVELRSVVADEVRITASSANWIGVYEVRAFGRMLASRPATRAVASSLVREDPDYSLARGYGAANLVDGNLNSLAYPGSSTIDYLLSLQGPSELTSATIHWKGYGTNSAYVSSWWLYGRNGSDQPWKTLASGGFPNTPATQVNLSTIATDLRLVAKSANWIGVYEVTLQGTAGGTVPGAAVTAVSNLPESSTYSIGRGYGAAKLVDGDPSTLAYPGARELDYTISLPHERHASAATIRWGGYGTNPAYVQAWTLLGRRKGESKWTLLSEGGFPGAESTTVSIDAFVDELRLTASSAVNWIGVYDVSLQSSQRLPVPRVTSNMREVPSSESYRGPELAADMDLNTFAYPDSPFTDYTAVLLSNTYVDLVRIHWGEFGSDPQYVTWWRLLGQIPGTEEWEVIKFGEFPDSATTDVKVRKNYSKVRLATASSNWTGVYELEVWGSSAK